MVEITESIEEVEQSKTIATNSTPGKANILSKEPLVATYNNILTDDECEHFIKIAKPNLQRALVSDNSKGIVSQGRTGMNTWIEHDHDDITKKVGERIANIVGMPLENAEKYQIIYYGTTQEYRQHYDSWDQNYSEKTLRCMKYGGARMKTALCYLNDVTKGGGTKMTRLDITVPAEKGKVLVFHNTISDDNHEKHPMSEHAGLPVEEGEKYAFNLWFKECNSKMLYKEYNPDYYKNDKLTEKKVLPEKTDIKTDIKTDMNQGMKFTIDADKLHDTYDIYRKNTFVDKSTCSDLVSSCKFNTNKRRDGWININTRKELVDKLESLIGVSKIYWENINVVEYLDNTLHNKHYVAYDLDSEKGQKYTNKLGQRLLTVSIALTDNIEINYTKLNINNKLNSGDILIYNNISQISLNRETNLERTINNKNGTTGYLANIYIREKSKKGISVLDKNNLPSTITIINTSEAKENPLNTSENLKLQISELENYSNTLNEVFDCFKNTSISGSWNGLNSFKYNFKGNIDTFKDYIAQYSKIRDDGGCLISENLSKKYDLDDKLPMQVVNNVIKPELLQLLQKYYKETIDNKVWVLGDKQSNRYKAHNEPMSRFLHYECLPLIEKIVGKSMKPTYTYLSAYVKGADLPPHTDRPECEYTVSFVVDKPEGSNWNIYVHKPQQSVKHKGRYDIKPPLEECEAVDCDAGGLMLFQGTDHIHFREELEEDYYNVLLLHYCAV